MTSFERRFESLQAARKFAARPSLRAPRIAGQVDQFIYDPDRPVTISSAWERAPFAVVVRGVGAIEIVERSTGARMAL